MATERGERTRLMFGGVSAEVSLVKTSGKPTEAKHDTRRMIGDRPAEDVRAEALQQWQQRRRAAEAEADATRDGGRAMASAIVEAEERDVQRRMADDGDPLGGGNVVTGTYLTLDDEPETDPYAELPEERIEQGVQLDDGSFIDLTARLAQIDEATKIEGLEVIATIGSTSVPRYRVRDSHWIGLAGDQRAKDKTPAKVLALLWRSLRATNGAAVVKWTKRTNQALGIIVAQGSDTLGTRRLCLLELEWSANMRGPGPRATMPLDVEVSARELAAAAALVEALHEPPAILDSVRDERNGKRAELLTAARDGKLEAFVAPVKAGGVPEGADLADQLASAGASR